MQDRPIGRCSHGNHKPTFVLSKQRLILTIFSGALLLLPTFFYSCHGGDGYTVLKVDALGRVARLGELFSENKQEFRSISIFKKPPPEDFIKRIGTPLTNAKYSVVRNLIDRMGLIELSGEAGVYVNLGIIKGTLSAGSAFIFDLAQAENTVTGAFNYKTETDLDIVEIFFDDMRDYISKEILEDSQDTHVCIGIGWGATMTISYTDRDVDKRMKISAAAQMKGSLDFLLNSAAVENLFPQGAPNWTGIDEGISFGGGIEGAINGTISLRNAFRNYRVKIYADLPFNGVDFPTDVTEMLTTIRQVPTLVKSTNEGRGKQMYMYLMPIERIRKFMNTPKPSARVAPRMTAKNIQVALHVIERLSFLNTKVTDLYVLFHENRDVVTAAEILRVGKLRSDLINASATLKQKLKDGIVSSRSDDDLEAESDGTEILAGAADTNITIDDPTLDTLEYAMDNEFKETKVKIKLAYVLRLGGTIWAGRGERVQTFIMKYFQDTREDLQRDVCLVHFYPWYLKSILHFLLHVKAQQKERQVVVVDCDFNHKSCRDLKNRNIRCTPVFHQPPAPG